MTARVMTLPELEQHPVSVVEGTPCEVLRRHCLGLGGSGFEIDPESIRRRGQRTMFVKPNAPRVLIAEAYNADPLSMAAALASFPP